MKKGIIFESDLTIAGRIDSIVPDFWEEAKRPTDRMSRTSQTLTRKRTPSQMELDQLDGRILNYWIQSELYRLPGRCLNSLVINLNRLPVFAYWIIPNL